ncbi:MAG TPA: hypothetical protein DCE42_27170 [Myxococcales bacterium]|nr:hypothetical protein [Deltaproteobacteria bacterium]HAA58474.1 hypothetical protein [Myxococcales bacterium]|tara:strand:- start:7287 stop:8939 length:1653 start_codon:yes stop_codon:yes gene_type:complete
MLHKHIFAQVGLLALFCIAIPTTGWSSTKKDRPSTIRRYALLIGNNSAGGRGKPLQWAEADARKIRDVLVQVSGFQKRHTWLLLNQKAQDVIKAMKDIRKHIQTWHAQRPTRKAILFVYYSGHAKDEHLLMGKTSLSFTRLHQLFRSTGAHLRLGIFDACESGALTKMKGLRRQKKEFHVPFIQLSTAAKGEVIITAAGPQENAHEDKKLRGGIFTHYLASGMRGAADDDKNGLVTLEETYQYAYARSLKRTIFSSHGPQRARFLKKLSGQGSFVLASLNNSQSHLHVTSALEGQFFIWDAKERSLFAEFKKVRGTSLQLALRPGRYMLHWRQGTTTYGTPIELKKHQRLTLTKHARKQFKWHRFETKGIQTVDKVDFVRRNIISPKFSSFGGISLYKNNTKHNPLDPEKLFQRGTTSHKKISENMWKLRVVTGSFIGSGVLIALGFCVAVLPLSQGNPGRFPEPTFIAGMGIMGASIGTSLLGGVFMYQYSESLKKAIDIHNKRIFKEANTLTSNHPRSYKLANKQHPTKKPVFSPPPITNPTTTLGTY